MYDNPCSAQRNHVPPVMPRWRGSHVTSPIKKTIPILFPFFILSDETELFLLFFNPNRTCHPKRARQTYRSSVPALLPRRPVLHVDAAGPLELPSSRGCWAGRSCAWSSPADHDVRTKQTSRCGRKGGAGGDEADRRPIKADQGRFEADPGRSV